LTPAQHPDYEGTQELLEVTDTMIRAMESVKIREEEYESFKIFASKIIGLPTGLVLAKRDRRLLGQGVLHRVELSDSERKALDYLAEEAEESSYVNATSHPMMSGNGTKGTFPKSSARRSIISDSAYGASPRPLSYFSDAASLAPSLSTAYSSSSANCDSSSTTFSLPMSTSLSSYSRTTSPSLHALGSAKLPNASTFSLRPDSMLSPDIAPPLPNKGNKGTAHSRQKSMSPSATPATSLRGILKSTSSIALSKTTSNKTTSHSKERPLQLFVFNDIVLFTSANSISAHAVSASVRGGLGLKPSKSSLKSHASSTTLQASTSATQKDDSTRFTVVDDWGVAKLIGVTDLSGRTGKSIFLSL